MPASKALPNARIGLHCRIERPGGPECTDRPAGRRNTLRSTPVSRILYRPCDRRRSSIWDARHRAPRCDVARGTGRPPMTNRAILLQVGFTRARVTATLRELLPHDFTLAGLRTTYATPAVCFCGTFLRVAPTGRYPAPCPMKPGLSSRGTGGNPPARRDRPAYFARVVYHAGEEAKLRTPFLLSVRVLLSIMMSTAPEASTERS